MKLSTNGVNIRFGGGSSMFGTYLDTLHGIIQFIYSMTVRNLSISKQFRFQGSITNISVKEVGQDWTFVGDC